MRLYSSGLTGKPNSWSWAQFYEYIPDDPELQNKGELFTIVGLSSDISDTVNNDKEFVLIGKEIFSRICDKHDGGRTGYLKSIKESVTSLLQEFSKRRKIQIGVISRINNILYLVTAGGAKIYLFRDGELHKLIGGEKEVEYASGYARPGDVVVNGTSYFFEAFGHGLLKASLETKNTEEVVEQFVPMIHAKEDSGGMAIQILSFLREERVLRDVNDKKVSRGFGLPEGLINVPSVIGGLIKRSLYVEGDPESLELRKRRKVTASVGLLLLFLLVISIFFGIKQKRELDFKRSFEQELSSARHKLEESENLSSLDPARSRELFLEARGKVLGLSAKVDDPEVSELKKKIEESQGKMLGEYRKEVQLFTDLGLLSDGFKGTQIVLAQGKIYVVDKDGRRIIRVSLPSKRAEVVAGPTKISEIDQFAVYSDKVYVLNSRGIFYVSDSGLEDAIDINWQGEPLLLSYASNIYLLDKDKSQVWRFSGDGENFSTGREWLSADSSVDLGKSISWAIDGSIWVLSEGGNVYKFTYGNLQQFDLSGDFIENFEPNFIFAGDGVNDLYFLDNKHNRILVFDKEGKYKSQYINDEIGNTQQIAVSEEEGKIILLNSNKIFTIDL